MNMEEALRSAVERVYSAIAENPQEKPPFPVGRTLALDLGYPAELLNSLPSQPVEAFSGVSCVSLFADIPEQATVLDLGCGGGLDALIASRRLREAGRVIGVDFSNTMLHRAQQATSLAGATNIAFLQAAAEALPLADASVDVVLVNGLFNLNPYRASIFCELARVVRPGGQVFAAEIVLNEPLSQQERADSDSWFR